MRQLCRQMISLNLTIVLCIMLAFSMPVFADGESVTVTYYSNGGQTGAGETQVERTYVSNSPVEIEGDDLFSKSGYVFLYWEKGYSKFTASSVCTFSSDTYLTAVWGYARAVYHGNGGKTLTGQTKTEQYINYYWSGEKFSGNNFLRDGYLFTGWNTSPDGSGNWIAPGSSMKTSGTYELYAQWEKLPESGCYITYCAGGTDIFGGREYTFQSVGSYPANVTLLPQTDTDEYIHAGWVTPDKIYYFSGDTISVDENITLTPAFAKKEIPSNFIQAIYSGNGGRRPNGGSLLIQNTSNGNLKLYSVGQFHKDGHYLSSWNTSPDGSGTEFAVSGSLDYYTHQSKTYTLYAQWEKGADKFITYVGNGGYVRGQGKDYLYQELSSYEDVEILPDDTFYNKDYRIVGWEDYEKNLYFPGMTYDFDGHKTLKAKWGYGSITYHNIHPETLEVLESETQIIEDWDDYVYDEYKYTLDGYLFAGWNTEPDGSGHWVVPEMEIETYIGNINLYTIWEKTPDSDYWFKYSANKTDVFGGKAFSYQGLDESPQKVLLAPMEDNSNFIYVGWSPSSFSSDYPIFAPQEEAEVKSKTTLYARYEKNRYDKAAAIYYANGGSGYLGGTAKYSHGYASVGGLTLYDARVFHKEGYYLTGWNTSPDGNGTNYEIGQRISDFNTTKKLYAQWEKGADKFITYIASDNSHQGDGARTPDGKTYVYSPVDSYDSVTLQSGDIFTNSEYSFIGWKDESGTKYTEGQTYDLGSHKTLYAMWGHGRITYNITDPSTQDTKSSETVYYTYSDEIKHISSSGFAGFEFAGWNTEPDGSGEAYLPGTTIDADFGIKNLYSVWEPLPTGQYYVKFDSVKTTVLKDRAFVYKEVENFDSPVTLIDGYDTEKLLFLGWKLPDGTIHAAGEKVMLSLNPTLNASTAFNRWTTVIMYGNGGKFENGSTVRYKNTSSGDLTLYNSDDFIPSGRKFIGWNTSPDGSGKSYTPDDTFPGMHSTYTTRLYAQWEEPDDSVGLTFTDCSFTLDGVKASLDVNYIKEDTTAVFSLYDESGRLLGTDTATIKQTDVQVGFYVPYTGDNKDVFAKVILVDSLDNMKPIGKAPSVWATELVVESPHPYPNSSNETYEISTSRDCESISITFSQETKTERGFDKIYIKDKNGTTVGTYSGTDLAGETITVSGNKIYINLKSDGSSNYYGFKITDIKVNPKAD
ncbi:MAG: CUB domain-containing protein [Clostridia bacterium]|nr:CUB domain-containing protein [Clostridia bacterium]